jgi:hypothetical protein
VKDDDRSGRPRTGVFFDVQGIVWQSGYPAARR